MRRRALCIAAAALPVVPLRGAGGGAFVSKDIGGGEGRVLATAAGTLVGTAVGAGIGRSLDHANGGYAEPTYWVSFRFSVRGLEARAHGACSGSRCTPRVCMTEGEEEDRLFADQLVARRGNLRSEARRALTRSWRESRREAR